ncbi:hypothetical protein TWF730_008134 [Orbilia blumenaviensis]|uniref:DUF676 domain-containing protein n=1 Tax=Orbilia blumenaviensis TaxID=1796055 RepID=A0AAV9V9W0_9PEZI
MSSSTEIEALAQDPKPLSFRIRHINKRHTKDDVRKCLENILKTEQKVVNDIYIEITSANDVGDTTRRVCVVTFHYDGSEPQPAPVHPSCFEQHLREANDELMLDIRDGRLWNKRRRRNENPDDESNYRITVDKGFRGLTPLYEPENPESVDANVIAVMGLTPNAYAVWQGEKSDKMWLRHFFEQSDNLKNCRSLIFGYNGDLWVEALYKKEDYTKGLMEDIVEFLRTHPHKPIIFVGHSYGGLLIADMLRTAYFWRQNPERYRIYELTKGIFFFATPHRGMFIDDLQKINSHKYRGEIIQGLQKRDLRFDGIFTEELKQFIQVIKEGAIKVYSFAETELTNQLEKSDDSIRPHQCVEQKHQVDRASAFLALSGHETEHHAEGKNHRNIIKFDNFDDRTYTAMLKGLKKCLEYIKQPTDDTVKAKPTRGESPQIAYSHVKLVSYALDETARLGAVRESLD